MSCSILLMLSNNREMLFSLDGTKVKGTFSPVQRRPFLVGAIRLMICSIPLEVLSCFHSRSVGETLEGVVANSQFNVHAAIFLYPTPSNRTALLSAEKWSSSTTASCRATSECVTAPANHFETARRQRVLVLCRFGLLTSGLPPPL